MVMIYALICDATRKAYVGCTKGKPAKRLREHRCLLNQRKHSCSEMVHDWHQFGSGSFQLVLIESLPADISVDQKRDREKFWMEEYNRKGLLYNTDMRSFELSAEQNRKGVELAREVNRGRIHSPESRLKRRLAQLGIPKGHGAKISATKLARKLNK
jgi:hypothetical protein